MAIQLNTTYTGRVEDLIYYERLGDYLIRTVQKQTTATKRAAKELGRASGLAKNLRRIITAMLPNPRDRWMQNKLTGAMGRFLASTEKHRFTDLQDNPLAGFRFTAGSFLKECLLFPSSITEVEKGKVSIGIPAINPVEAISAPAGTSKVEIIFMAATIHPDNDLPLTGVTTVLEIPYTNGIQDSIGAEFETGNIPGAVTVLTAAVKYWNGSEEIRQPGFMPVEIVTAKKSE